MAAGNTYYEGLSQGLCEIIERYVQREFYFNNITPPTIPEDYIKNNYPYEFYLMKLIENQSNLKIIVKDCSLGKQFPVVGIIIHDYKNNLVGIKFGADLDIKIAIQRCFTELLQGVNISNIIKLSKLNFIDKNNKEYFNNFRNIVCTGIGQYPISFFSDYSTYKFSPNENKYYSNKDKFFFLLKIIQKAGFKDIYIRDVSFMKFPSFFIIIPGMSETFFWNEKNLKLFSKNLIKYIFFQI